MNKVIADFFPHILLNNMENSPNNADKMFLCFCTCILHRYNFKSTCTSRN